MRIANNLEDIQILIDFVKFCQWTHTNKVKFIETNVKFCMQKKELKVQDGET